VLSEAQDAVYVDFVKACILLLDFRYGDFLAQLIALSLVCRPVNRSPLVVNIGVLKRQLLAPEFRQVRLEVGPRHFEGRLSRQVTVRLHDNSLIYP
jgi:hypothetical protein